MFNLKKNEAEKNKYNLKEEFKVNLQPQKWY